MSLAQQIKPISYLKSHAADIIKNFATNPDPLIITQNGEAKMVVLDIQAYEQQQETMALLKLIAMGNKELAQGQFQEADDFFSEMALNPELGSNISELDGTGWTGFKRYQHKNAYVVYLSTDALLTVYMFIPSMRDFRRHLMDRLLAA
eukprot:gene15729-17976_t